MMRVLAIFLLTLGNWLPAWGANAAAVASTVDASIQANMVSRGYAANDPRYGATLTAVRNAAAASVGTAAAGLLAAGSSPAWGTVLAVSVLGAGISYGVSLAVDSAVRWLFSPAEINVTGQASQGGSSIPASSAAIVAGGNAFVAHFWNGTALVLGYTGDAFSALQGMFRCEGTGTYYCSTATTKYYPSCALQSGVTYVCQIRRAYLNAGGSVYADEYVTSYSVSQNNPSPATCAAGNYGLAGGGCTGIAYATNPAATPPSLNGTRTFAMAASELPTAVLTAPLDPSTTALMSNALWARAASQPGYAGFPYSPTSPVTSAQVQNTGPQPTVADLVAPTSISSIQAAPSPNSTPGPSTNPATSTLVNLGDDPAIGSPAAMEAPNWISPLFDLLPGWRTASFTQTGTCMQPAFDLTAVGLGNHVLTEHCELMESQRSTISAIMVVAWALVAAFIVLRA